MISKEKGTESEWVLVELTTKQCIKYYAGNIATVLRDENKGDFVCNFLQKKANNQFIWPEQKDDLIIDVSQIKMFLPRPNNLMCGKSTGSSFVFHIDFNKFNGKIFLMVKPISLVSFQCNFIV